MRIARRGILESTLGSTMPGYDEGITMRIGIIGSGPVGRAIGRGLAAKNHDVMISSRNPDDVELKGWGADTGGRVASVAETASHAEFLFLATKWDGTQAAIEAAGDALTGKVLVDVTNPLDFSAGFPPGLAVGHTDSGGESVQRWAPGAQVVKALNIIGNPDMVDPSFPDGPPTMWIGGDSAEAKDSAKALLGEMGWTDIIDLGGLEAARLLEPMCILWVRSAATLGTWDVGFRLLRR
jgi:predicted dinucleotide-binding enzyme